MSENFRTVASRLIIPEAINTAGNENSCPTSTSTEFIISFFEARLPIIFGTI